jgi:hypothetical protein
MTEPFQRWTVLPHGKFVPVDENILTDRRRRDSHAVHGTDAAHDRDPPGGCTSGMRLMRFGTR